MAALDACTAHANKVHLQRVCGFDLLLFKALLLRWNHHQVITTIKFYNFYFLRFQNSILMAQTSGDFCVLGQLILFDLCKALFKVIRVAWATGFWDTLTKRPKKTRPSQATRTAKLRAWNFGSTIYCNGWPCRNTA
jgi:hypothetical protein